MSDSKLMPISYYNPSQEVRLTAYADTIVLEQDGGERTIRAIRLGGYPEMVRAMSDAIYAGALIDAEIQGKTYRLKSECKRYERQFNHDGVYAEATLLAKDDDQNAKNENKEDEKRKETDVPANLPPRKCIIFCPRDDEDRLFEELDRKTAVPLIPSFREYVLGELQRRGDLRRLTVISLREKLDAWALQCENGDKNIISVVEDGLRSGAIRIPCEVKDPDGFEGVENVTGYLNTFGVTVAQRIRKQFEPLFDPAAAPLSQEVLDINDFVREHAGYPLYDAQLAVAEAVRRQLQKEKCAFIVAECGSGKSKIGSVAMLSALWSVRHMRQKTFNVILCPSHVAKKWVREIAETLPDAYGMVVRSIAEFDRLYELYEQGDRSVCAIISKEKARDGYMKRPAVIPLKRRNSATEFLCPDCMSRIEVPLSSEEPDYLVPASQLYFRKENKKNHKCPACGSLLWTAVNPDEQSDWIKIGGYGWVYRHAAWEHFEKTKNEAVLEKLHEIQSSPNAPFRTVGACRRYPLSSYIKRKYSGRIDCLIADELHQYNNDSGQGDAMGEIFAAARKFIGMTATLINGYASGIFHLLYRTMPSLMLQDGKRYAGPGDFNAEYGVEQVIYEETDPDYASNRRATKSDRRVKQLPGVSPLVFSRFLLEKTAFLSLSDMGKELPDYEEIPVAVHMEPEVEEAYEKTQKVLQSVLKSDRRVAQKILSAYLNLLTVYPDQPYDQPPILHPITGTPIVEPPSIGDFDTLGEKETAVLEVVQRKIAEGEHVLIYTSWVRSDSQKKLLKLLTDNGIHAEIMSEKTKPDEREDWVQRRLAAGMQVMITNPSLVETGLDLNTFTTLIFYSMGYKLFTLRQASRRSWRINQTAPKVEVYMIYYADTMQHKAMKLMASKLAVAGLIEGSFSEEGLAAMSDVQDMTSQMAKELMLGIRDNVEDVSAAFKKMAIVNPNRHTPTPPKTLEAPNHTVVTVIPTQTPRTGAEMAAIYASLLEEQNRKRKPKKIVEDENQMTLFDFVA